MGDVICVREKKLEGKVACAIPEISHTFLHRPPASNTDPELKTLASVDNQFKADFTHAHTSLDQSSFGYLGIVHAPLGFPSCEVGLPDPP